MSDKQSRMVDGADQFYKHWSFWGILLLGVLPFIEANSDLISAVIPARYQPIGQLVLAALVAVARFVRQSGIKP